MQLTLKYDPEASVIAEKPTFFVDLARLTRSDIKEFKVRKWLNFVEEDTLPELINCQALLYFEGPRKAKVVFFNQLLQLPEEVFEEPFLNRNLIEWSKNNGGFWIEFTFPLNASWNDFILDWKMG